MAARARPHVSGSTSPAATNAIATFRTERRCEKYSVRSHLLIGGHPCTCLSSRYRISSRARSQMRARRARRPKPYRRPSRITDEHGDVFDQDQGGRRPLSSATRVAFSRADRMISRNNLHARIILQMLRAVYAESARGISPRAAHRSGHDTLASSGSCHR